MACVLMLLPIFGLTAEIIGEVVGVHDVDSITVRVPGSDQLKVRLEGIDAPELKQPFGNASKAELSRLVFGKQVRIEEKGKDRYGRTFGSVFVGVEWVNASQVKAGMAWVYLKYSKNPKLLAAESLAKRLQHGLWREVNAIPPWEWREAKTKTASSVR